MLVLTRKEGEAVYIQNNIKITVVNIGTNSVKIGFDCPPEITIMREELYLSIIQTNTVAQNMNIDDYEGVKVLWKKTKKV